MEPYTKQMMKEDTALRSEFYKRLNEDTVFRNNGGERLDFFYKHSPFYDKRENIYPIMRLLNAKI
jgi:hypothetical protein